MNLSDLVIKCSEKYNVSMDTLRGLAFAICFSDKFNGTNRLELGVDRFAAITDKDWLAVLQTLGVQPQLDGAPLPKVQQLRVISDILSIVACGEVADLHLMSKASSLVAKKRGVSLPYEDYADELACNKNLDKIREGMSSANADSAKGVYLLLCGYSNYLSKEYDIKMTDFDKVIPVPKAIYKGLGKECSDLEVSSFLKKKDICPDMYGIYMMDYFCYILVQKIAKLLDTYYKKNEVAFNLLLTRLSNYAVNYLPVGTFSIDGFTERLSVLTNVPSYLSRKVKVTFSASSHFDEITIQGCLSILALLNKSSMRKCDFESGMEVCISGCRNFK